MSENPAYPPTLAEEFERLTEPSVLSVYVLRLYVSGMTPRSTEAINNLNTLCDAHLKGRCEVEVIDVYKHPEMTGADQIIATPTLVKRLPLPIRHLVGTLSNEERVLVGLDIVKKA